MAFIIDTFKVIALVLGFIFAAWPLIVVAPLGWRRGDVLRGMTFAWVIMFLSWLMVRATSTKPASFLIPEPLNSYVFFLTGAILIGIFVGRGVVRRGGIRRSADKARSPRDLLDVSPTQFEDMVVEVYRMRGAKAWRTGATGDHGVDVVVETPRGEKWVVQCKRWRGWVGEPQVRDFYGTMQHEKAHKGVLVTTGTFSNAARRWVQGKPLSLVDGKTFLKAWKDAKKG